MTEQPNSQTCRLGGTGTQLAPMKRLLLTVLAILMAASGQPTAVAQAPGTVSGRVSVRDAGSVAGATVTITRISAPARSYDQYSERTATGRDGSFSLSGVAPGKLQICVSAPGTTVLENCAWGSATEVDIAPGQTASGVQVFLEMGSWIEVDVDDPQGHLTREGRASGTQLLVGVWTPWGTFQRAAVKQQGRNNRVHEILVPVEVDIAVGVHGQKLVVEDANGRRVRVTDVPAKFKIAKNEAGSRRVLRYRVRDVEP